VDGVGGRGPTKQDPMKTGLAKASEKGLGDDLRKQEWRKKPAASPPSADQPVKKNLQKANQHPGGKCGKHGRKPVQPQREAEGLSSERRCAGRGATSARRRRKPGAPGAPTRGNVRRTRPCKTQGGRKGKEKQAWRQDRETN